MEHGLLCMLTLIIWHALFKSFPVICLSIPPHQFLTFLWIQMVRVIFWVETWRILACLQSPHASFGHEQGPSKIVIGKRGQFLTDLVHLFWLIKEVPENWELSWYSSGACNISHETLELFFTWKFKASYIWKFNLDPENNVPTSSPTVSSISILIFFANFLMIFWKTFLSGSTP